MDLKIHRAMTLIAARRAYQRLKDEGKTPAADLLANFKTLWLGNWLTDMSQATCFFDVFEKRKDPYSVFSFQSGDYRLPKLVRDHEKSWVGLFAGLWEHECKNSQISFLTQPGAVPSKAQEIRGYHPYDHFDVVDPLDANGHWISREADEFKEAQAKRMTLTAHQGVYAYAHEFWLKPAFSARKFDLKNAFLNLGHGIHILQDFFAHSNYVELLLNLGGEQQCIDPGLWEALQSEREGTYASYCPINLVPFEQTPVMTGRFDRIDTVATLIKIYANGLIPRWRDLSAGGFDAGSGKMRDLIFEVMFGTFSNNPFTPAIVDKLKKGLAVKDWLEAAKDSLVDGVITIFADVAALFSKDKEAADAIHEVSGLLKEAEVKEARDWAKAGRLFYVEHVIEQKLRKGVEEAKELKLPHHTLLAKDNDVLQPEVRLAYKLSCFLATEVTARVLYHFAAGDPSASALEVLRAYFRHPALLLSENQVPGVLRELTKDLYGQRWWYAAEKTGIQVLG